MSINIMRVLHVTRRISCLCLDNVHTVYTTTCILMCVCLCQGVLLYGPPGTGKTLLARAVAHHTECTFIRVSGSELVQKFIGEGARMVRELFVMARYVRTYSCARTVREQFAMIRCTYWTRLWCENSSPWPGTQPAFI